MCTVECSAHRVSVRRVVVYAVPPTSRCTGAVSFVSGAGRGTPAQNDGAAPAESAFAAAGLQERSVGD